MYLLLARVIVTRHARPSCPPPPRHTVCCAHTTRRAAPPWSRPPGSPRSARRPSAPPPNASRSVQAASAREAEKAMEEGPHGRQNRPEWTFKLLGMFGNVARKEDHRHFISRRLDGMEEPQIRKVLDFPPPPKNSCQ